MKLWPSIIIQKQNADSPVQKSRIRHKKVKKDKVEEEAQKNMSH
jgi:hypothetical protein